MRGLQRRREGSNVTIGVISSWEEAALMCPGELPAFVGSLSPITTNGTIWHDMARFQRAVLADLDLYPRFTEISEIQRYTRHGSVHER
jgi:hypothetical protein